MRPQLLLALVLCLLWPLSARAHLELVFLTDTTGSMSRQIREAKERVRQLTEALRRRSFSHAQAPLTSLALSALLALPVTRMVYGPAPHSRWR